MFNRLWASALINLVMALALTCVAMLDVLISPHGDWDAGQPAPTTYRTAVDKRCAFDDLLRTSGGGGERFLSRRGEPVGLAQLDELKRQLPEKESFSPLRAAGLAAFYFLVLTFFNLVMRRTGQHLELRFRAVGTLYLVLLVIVTSARFVFDYTTLSLYAAPTLLAVLMMAPLLRQTSTFAIHLVAVAVVAPLIRFTPGMLLVPLATGWTAAVVLRQGAGPIRMILAVVSGVVVGGAALAGLDLFTPYAYDFSPVLEGDLTGLALGAAGAVVFALLFQMPVTLMFGAVPRSKLARLRDLEHPVLRDLAENAPGTFQHTLSVANMAEKVALDIGADDELVRVGAYYHDIGKMREPKYFSENQQGENPHDQIAPADSVKKLRGHVIDGQTIARGADLPERVVDFVVEHHGASTMDYFLDKAARAAGKELDPRQFAYHGRNPTSRETAVLMIVDSVEAASRTLRDPDHKQIENLVRQIIFGKLLRGYLDDSGLTTRDMKRMGQSLVAYLDAQFHVRVEYPWQRVSVPPMETASNGRVATPIAGVPAAASASQSPAAQSPAAQQPAAQQPTVQPTEPQQPAPEPGSAPPPTPDDASARGQPAPSPDEPDNEKQGG